MLAIESRDEWDVVAAVEEAMRDEVEEGVEYVLLDDDEGTIYDEVEDEDGIEDDERVGVGVAVGIGVGVGVGVAVGVGVGEGVGVGVGMGVGDGELLGARDGETADCGAPSEPLIEPLVPPSKTTKFAVDPFGTVTTQKFAPPAPSVFLPSISLALCLLGSIAHGSPLQSPSQTTSTPQVGISLRNGVAGSR